MPADRFQSLEQQLGAADRHRLSNWRAAGVPSACAGVYAVWRFDDLVYVGMSGRGMTADRLATAIRPTGLATRLASHASGRRSGDQFCIYVADHIVLDELTDEDRQDIIAGQLYFDSLVRQAIERELLFVYVICADGNEASALERHLFEHWRPRWNSATTPK